MNKEIVEINEAYKRQQKRITEAKFDRSLGASESKNFPVLKNNKGIPFIGKKFNGYEQNIMFGPALEKNVKSWLTGKIYPQYTTIIWIPDALAPHKGIIIPIEELIEVLNGDDNALKAKIQTIGLSADINQYSKYQLEISK